MRTRLAAVSLTLIGGMMALNASAAESHYATLESLDQRFDALIPPDTKIEKIADDLKWSEGPLWDAQPQVPAVLRHPAQRRHAMARRQGRVALPREQRLHRRRAFHGQANPAPMASPSTCRAASRCASTATGAYRAARRTAPWSPLATSYEGKRLNSPNDLVFDQPGRALLHRSALRPARHVQGPDQGAAFPGRVPRRDRTASITLLTKELEAPERARLHARLQDAVRRQLAEGKRRSGRPTR